jgi:carboxyl-terminal processing protease
MNERIENTSVPPVHGGDGKERNRPGGSLLGIGLAILLATATFFSGLHLGSVQNTSLEANLSSWSSLFRPVTQADNSVDLTQFWKVWNILNERFVSSTTTVTSHTTQDKVHGAISGLVKSYGDPYTVFMPPQQAAMFQEDISGNFSGVGMEVGMRDDVVTIISPLPGSPAEKAGLAAGDAIIRIDGASTEGMGIDEAVRLIRGEKGTQVKLTIFRTGESEFRDIEVTRDTISIPTSKTEEKGDVFVISLYSFNALSEAEMQSALRKYVESGKKKLILDLRGNPGGYLQSAVSIASYFLPVGKVVVRENFGGDTEEQLYRSSGKELGDSAPEKMVVLVDGGSASASEILAGALKEHGAATLIGAQTFGKGSVQELIELEDGSSLKVTIARWFTPNGISISAGGLAPDIAVERTVEDRTAGKDPQLDAALDFLAK